MEWVKSGVGSSLGVSALLHVHRSKIHLAFRIVDPLISLEARGSGIMFPRLFRWLRMDGWDL